MVGWGAPRGSSKYDKLREMIRLRKCVSFKFKIEFKAMIDWVEDEFMVGNNHKVIQIIGTQSNIIPILFPFLFQ